MKNFQLGNYKGKKEVSIVYLNLLSLSLFMFLLVIFEVFLPGLYNPNTKQILRVLLCSDAGDCT